MILLHFWQPADILLKTSYQQGYDSFADWERSVGHVSISVSLPDGRQNYLSFWPKEYGSAKADLKTLLKSLAGVALEQFTTAGFFVDSLYEDVQELKSKPTKTIEIKGLNEQIIFSEIAVLRQKNSNYNLFKKNCSTMVFDVLSKAAKGSNSKLGNFQTVLEHAKRYKEFAKFTAIIAAVKQSGGSFDPTLLGRFDLSIGDLISLLIETLQGKTPTYVLHYVQRLNKAS